MRARIGPTGMVAVLTLVACSTTPLTNARVVTRDFASGTRLLARGWDVEGALVLRDFFDAERNEVCSFQDASFSWWLGPGPSYYCLPRNAAVHTARGGPFADDACTVPLAAAATAGLLAPAASTEPPRYALVRPANACATPPRVHRLGESKRAFPHYLRDGACVSTDEAIATYVLGEEIPLASFVRATEQVLSDPPAEPGARIAPLALVGDDGTRVTLGGFDRERSEAVTVDRRGAPRWVPLHVAFSGAGEVLFEDAACTIALATKLAYDAACPLTATVAFEGACATVSYRSLGPPVDPARSYRRSATCTAVAGERGDVVTYRAGAPIDPSAFAPAIATDVGGSAIARRGYAGPGGVATVAWGDVLDRGTSEPCEPAVAADGALRCLPIAAADVSLFADATCTRPAFFDFPANGCESRQRAAFVRGGGESGSRVYQVIGEVPQVYEGRGASCAPSTLPGRGFVVEEVDVRRFAPVAARERL